MNAPVRVSAWSTAVPDWKDRILAGQSLVPKLPLHQAVADKALRIFKRLRVPDIIGNPTLGEVFDWKVFELVEVIFGSFDPVTKARALQEFFVMWPKKNGKTLFAAGIMVTAAIMNERPEAELLFIAPTKDVADGAFKAANGMVRLDPVLLVKFHPQDHLKKLTFLPTRAVLEIKSADGDVVTGSKATYVLIDETHVFSGRAKAAQVFLELRGGLAVREDGFLLQITTQSKERPAGVFKNELDRARAVRDGKLQLPMLAVIYELPIEVAVDDGWKRRELWPLVNPYLNKAVRVEFLEEQLRTAEEAGADQLALFASQHFNVEIGVALNQDRWSGAIYWEAAGDKSVSLERILAECEVCTIALDGGGLDDLAALAVVGRLPDGDWLSWVRVWAQPDVLIVRKAIAPTLRGFVEDGDLVICDEPDQELEEMADICEQVRDAGFLPQAKGVGYDAHGGLKSMKAVLGKRGVVEPLLTFVKQGWALQPAVTNLPRMLKHKTFRHADQPIMAWCVGNAKQVLKGSNYVVEKQAAGSAKIDPLVALFGAAMLMFEDPMASGLAPKSYLETSSLMVL